MNGKAAIAQDGNVGEGATDVYTDNGSGHVISCRGNWVAEERIVIISLRSLGPIVL